MKNKKQVLMYDEWSEKYSMDVFGKRWTDNKERAFNFYYFPFSKVYIQLMDACIPDRKIKAHYILSLGKWKIPLSVKQ